MTAEGRPGTINQAVQRGLDTVHARPGWGWVGSSQWDEDAVIIGTIADLLHLQAWRRRKGLSLTSVEEALATARDVYATEDVFTGGLEKDAEVAG